MKRILCIIGIPGSGKTTLVRAVFEHWDAEQKSTPFPHIVRSNQGQEVVEFGRVRSAFGGTDALHMGIQPRVVEFLAHSPYRDHLAEGDRLGNGKFFAQVRALGVEVTVCLLDMPEALAAERRQARGSSQDPTWIRGRVTKVGRLAQQASIVIDATQPIAAQIAPIGLWLAS